MQSYSCIIENKTTINRSPRVIQMEGMFDVPPTEKSTVRLQVDLPLSEKDWNIGLIIGPSGAGKTTIAKKLWPREVHKNFKWSKTACIMDEFPKDMSIKEICRLLQDVGMSTPPSWMRPFHVLSTGEKFRVEMARALAESAGLVVVDEFTSVIDRTVARVASATISKAIRKSKKKMIAVSCHYDVEKWLQPDWIYEPHVNIFRWRRLWRFPKIILTVKRVHHSAWELFKSHHYLSKKHIAGALCFVAFFEGVPVAYQSVINLLGVKRNRRRGHRLVVLPDYQGIGIGLAMRNHIGSLLKANGIELLSKTSLPAVVMASIKDDNWAVTELFKHATAKYGKRYAAFNKSRSASRLTSSFRYVGKAYPDSTIAREMVYPKK